MSDKTELSIDTPEYRKLLGAVTEASQRGYAHGEADEEKWITANRALINYIDAWNRRATIQPTAHSLIEAGALRQYRHNNDVSPNAEFVFAYDKAITDRVLAVAPADAVRDAPIKMILHCPQCYTQHIDAPDERTEDWTNPPHRSHLCHHCSHIWRPADVATEGVAAIETRGGHDHPVNAPEAEAARDAEQDRRIADATRGLVRKFYNGGINSNSEIWGLWELVGTIDPTVKPAPKEPAK